MAKSLCVKWTTDLLAKILKVQNARMISASFVPNLAPFQLLSHVSAGAHKKFLSLAKVLAAVPSISQRTE